MRVISKKKLQEFLIKHPDNKKYLTHWWNTLFKNDFPTITDLQTTFSDVEHIGGQLYIFNLKGNHYRIICIVQFGHQTTYIKDILTHAEYTKKYCKKRY